MWMLSRLNGLALLVGVGALTSICAVSAHAASLSDEEMQDIAAYLQGAEPVKPSAKIVGSVPPQVAPCTACHGENGLGVDAPMTPKPPVLADQHVDYLEQALTTY